jgi:hypothetical protein
MSQPRHTLLLIDDDPEVYRVLALCVEDDSVKLVPAYNGSEALDLARQQTFDLILLKDVRPLRRKSPVTGLVPGDFLNFVRIGRGVLVEKELVLAYELDHDHTGRFEFASADVRANDFFVEREVSNEIVRRRGDYQPGFERATRVLVVVAARVAFGRCTSVAASRALATRKGKERQSNRDHADRESLCQLHFLSLRPFLGFPHYHFITKQRICQVKILNVKYLRLCLYTIKQLMNGRMK